MSRASRASIRILAINDVYELSNLPRLLNLRKTLRPQPDAFVVAGDFLSPSILSSVDQGRGMVDMLNAIGVTHVCFGNHEADLPLDILSERIQESKFQWINTNMPLFPGFGDQNIPPKRDMQHRRLPHSQDFRESNVTIQLLEDSLRRQALSSSKARPKSSASLPSSVRQRGGKPSPNAASRDDDADAAAALPMMTAASFVDSKCGQLSVALLGFISDESDMFRDGTFKKVAISPVARSVASAHELLCCSGGGGDGGDLTTAAITLSEPFVSSSSAAEVENGEAEAPPPRRRRRRGASAVIPLTHQTMHADAFLARFCAAQKIPLPLILGGHEHEMMLEVHPPGEPLGAVSPHTAAATAAAAAVSRVESRSGARGGGGGSGGGGGARQHGLKRQRRQRQQAHQQRQPMRSSQRVGATHYQLKFASPSRVDRISSSSKNSNNGDATNATAAKSSRAENVSGAFSFADWKTLVVKTGSDAEHAAVVDVHFTARRRDNDDDDGNAAGGEGKGLLSARREFDVSGVDVSMVDVTAVAADLPAQLRAERHLAVVSNLEDAPLVDMRMFQHAFSSSSNSSLLPPLASPTAAAAADAAAAAAVNDIGGLPWGSVGLGAVPLSSKRTRFQQSTVGALLALAAREELGVDVCAINGAPIKGDRAYEGGVLTFRQLKEELPFPTKMVTVPLPGSVLQAAVAHSRSAGEDGKERRGFLQLDPGVVVEGQYQWLAQETSAARSPPLPTGYGGNVFLDPREDGGGGGGSSSDDDEAGEGAGRHFHYQQHQHEHRIVSVQGQAFDPERTYVVALPRNLLKGFCNIDPLVEWYARAEALKAEALLEEAKAEASWEQGWMAFGDGTQKADEQPPKTDEQPEGEAAPAPAPPPARGDVQGAVEEKVLTERQGKEEEEEGGGGASESPWEKLRMSFDSLVGKKLKSGTRSGVPSTLSPAAAAAASATASTPEEASRLLPGEDAYIPCFNLVVSFFTKAHWRELASTFTFDDIDRDKSGRIDREEVALVYARKHGHRPPGVLLDAMMTALGKAESDAINRHEFEALLATQPDLMFSSLPQPQPKPPVERGDAAAAATTGERVEESEQTSSVGDPHGFIK